ncbi:hypothetical protein Trydic_g3570 [Trypoxylus dichotomus]
MLMQYRIMPLSSTNQSPSELMFGRHLRSRLNLLLPEEAKIEKVNEGKKIREFQVGERVHCRNYGQTVKWRFGKVLKRTGKLHYGVILDDGRIWSRHTNQIRKLLNPLTISRDTDAVLDYYNNAQRYDPVANETAIPHGDHTNVPPPENVNQRPRRNVRLPVKLKDFEIEYE